MPSSISKSPSGRATEPTFKDEIKAFALGEGFDVVRFTDAEAAPRNQEGLEAYLSAGHHGAMDWMETRKTERADPVTLWPEARSVIVLGMNYGPGCDPLAVLGEKDKAAISVYAQGDDYHDVVKKKLKAVAGRIYEKSKMPVKVFVDTAPVMEKPLAQKAGLGWQGKHTNLVSREFGSWLFLGSIFTAVAFAPDHPESDHCGRCRACLDICPTAAFPAPYRLDARRCISYLTIENKGPIPREFRAAMGNRIYGCDDCLAVCPWNKFAQKGRDMKLGAREELRAPDLAMLARLDDAGFRTLFRKSPVKRIGRDRFLRNVLIAIGNSGDADLAAPARHSLEDPSALVRGAAVWALRRLLADADFSALSRRHLPCEGDDAVRAEWQA
ncbi:MAG: tRNA epoxyqueuosine(34) reductase QueG [Alphaproteobacteria bacterium]|nr:tRNA epoxyqueuosine(34) reductase QueG [Alphaproteobacteria bacterium]